jgi:hypothetical protein
VLTLKADRYVFRVRALLGGSTDPTPATKRFTVIRRR